MDGLSQIDQIIDRLDDIESDCCALTDHGTISGCVDFFSVMKKAGKKSLLGCEFYVSNDASQKERGVSHQVIIAKNLQGWKDLIKLVSWSNQLEHFYYKPRIDYEILKEYASKGNLISFSGHLGSTLANEMFDGETLVSDWKNKAIKKTEFLREIFGKDNFYLEVQLFDSFNKTMQICGKAIREISNITKIPCVATCDAHYPSQERAQDHRILVATNLKTTLKKASASGKFSFFKSDLYHIHSTEEMQKIHTEEELANTVEIANKCEEYNILNKPILPQFICPNGLQPKQYFRDICKDGWRKLFPNVSKETVEFQQYGQRIEHELQVIEKANLSSYFLILKDICDFIEKNNWIKGPARGSACGCMISYLSGITSINPLDYHLLFERFYNEGRNTKDHISMPDIDLDVPSNVRPQIMEYIKEKYGKNKVGQIITFGSMKGRGAIKRVLSVYGDVGFAEQNAITEHIEDEHKIAGDLEEEKEEGGDPSIIKWALEHRREKFKDWVVLKDDGVTLEGPLADRFETAIRLEGTYISQGVHPAGLVISQGDLDEICPFVMDKKKKSLCAGFRDKDCESLGLVKLDILGVSMLDKIQTIQKMISK